MSAVALHPAERRKIAAMMPPAAPHDVIVRPLGGGDARTIIATSAAQNFVEALFEDLRADDWNARLAGMRGLRRGTDGRLELGLPIHRKFQIALFEIVCHQPGSPRLDPAKIASQGMVLRRWTSAGWTGWMKSGKSVSGWLPLADPEADPDPAQRAAAHSANAAARSLIARNKGLAPLPEDVIRLYLAPPDVCVACRRTILFGMVPVVSSERSDGPPPRLDYAGLPAADRAEMENHLSEYLKARPPLDMPNRGAVLMPDWKMLDIPPANDVDAGRLHALGIFLQQMLVELDYASGGAAATRLMGLLGQIRLPAGASSIDAATFVRQAAPVLIGREKNSAGHQMPLAWPRVDSGLGAQLTAAALDCLTERHAQLSASPGKFDAAKDEYAVRAFIRLVGHDGCPDHLVWAPAYSETFRVVPWWDGDGPGTKISLPDLSQLGKVKPNVTFEMPPALANLLKGDMKKLKDGDGSTDGLQLGWLCSFSIPIITLCAFIVLNIFLSLFDLIFQWMIMLKICIPIPKKS